MHSPSSHMNDRSHHDLINGTHHSSERMEYIFMVFREYTIIFPKIEILGKFKKSTPTYPRKCPRIDHILTFKLKVITKRKMSKNSKNY